MGHDVWVMNIATEIATAKQYNTFAVTVLWAEGERHSIRYINRGSAVQIEEGSAEVRREARHRDLQLALAVQNEGSL